MSDIDDLASRMRAEAERAQRRFDGQNTLAFNQHDVLALLDDRDRLAAEVERLRARAEALRDRLQEGVDLFEMTDECNAPPSDEWAWCFTSQDLLREIGAALATPTPTAPERDERAIRAAALREAADLVKGTRLTSTTAAYLEPFAAMAMVKDITVRTLLARAAEIEGGAPPVNTEDGA